MTNTLAAAIIYPSTGNRQFPPKKLAENHRLRMSKVFLPDIGAYSSAVKGFYLQENAWTGDGPQVVWHPFTSNRPTVPKGVVVADVDSIVA